MKAIMLKKSKKMAIAQSVPDYEVYFYGEKIGDLYFNMTGYVGWLPCPSERQAYCPLTIGEASLAAYKREIKELNKEWKEKNE